MGSFPGSEKENGVELSRYPITIVLLDLILPSVPPDWACAVAIVRVAIAAPANRRRSSPIRFVLVVMGVPCRRGEGRSNYARGDRPGLLR